MGEERVGTGMLAVKAHLGVPAGKPTYVVFGGTLPTLHQMTLPHPPSRSCLVALSPPCLQHTDAHRHLACLLRAAHAVCMQPLPSTLLPRQQATAGDCW
jgi:hypothetical protein